MVICITFGCCLVAADLQSAIQCIVEQGLTSESTWACGYCLEVNEKGKKWTAKGMKMDKSQCEKQKEIGE